MDHLHVSRDPISPPPEIPLLCDPLESISHPFHQYPLKCSPKPWPRALNLPGQWPFSHAEIKTPSNVAELEAFTQSWLFFCFLHELLSPFGLFDLEEWTEESDGRTILKSSTLPDRLDEWVVKVRELPEEDSKARAAHVISCFLLFRGTMAAVGTHGTKYNHNLLVMLATIIELVNGAIHDVTDAAIHFGHIYEFDENDERGMLDNGWCPFEIKAAQNLFLSAVVRHYFRNLRKPANTRLKHDKCTHDICLSAQVDKKSYQSVHVCKDNPSCPPVFADDVRVQNCLAEGTYPLLDLTDFSISNPEIHIVPYVSGTPYVALSHVWVDGLGNPSELALPQCQILRMKNIIDSMRGRRFCYASDDAPGAVIEHIENTRLLLWLDTLYCPVSGEYQEAALAKMRDVYFQAKYVIVLEHSIESFAFAEMDNIEACLRIATSKWCLRAWTLQEAGLCRKLMFKFADGVIDYREIAKDVQHRLKAHRSLRPLYSAAHSTGLALRNWEQRRYPDPPELYRNTLVKLIEHLQHRRLSVASDEALCLATLFNLDDQRPIVEALPERRMEVFWREFSEKSDGLSQSVVFNTRPRLKTEGHQWAPSTLMGINNEFWMCFVRENDVKGIYTPHGFLSKGSAWRLHSPGRPLGVPDATVPVHSLHHHLPMLRGSDGAWYQILRNDIPIDIFRSPDIVAPPNVDLSRPVLDLVRDTSHTWYLIHDANPRGDYGTETVLHGLLARPQKTIDGVTVLRCEYPIRISPTHSVLDANWRHGYRYAELLRQAWPARLMGKLSLVEDTCLYLVANDSQLADNWIVRACWKWARFIRRKLQRSEFRVRLLACSQAQQDLEAYKAHMAAGGDAQEFWKTFSLYVNMPFIGRYAQVVEELPKRNTVVY